MTEKNQTKLLEDLYPYHFNALSTANLTPSKIQTLKEQVENNKTEEIKKNIKK